MEGDIGQKYHQTRHINFHFRAQFQYHETSNLSKETREKDHF